MIPVFAVIAGWLLTILLLYRYMSFNGHKQIDSLTFSVFVASMSWMMAFYSVLGSPTISLLVLGAPFAFGAAFFCAYTMTRGY